MGYWNLVDTTVRALFFIWRSLVAGSVPNAMRPARHSRVFACDTADSFGLPSVTQEPQ